MTGGKKTKRGFTLAASRFVASGFGTGYFPVVPGTVGTLPAVFLWYLVPSDPILAVIGALLLLLSLPGMRSFTEEEGPDPSKIVVDEMAGFIVAGLFHARTLTSALILFFLFRIFDILKPWPASWANRQEGLVHVVLDDLAAGLYASLLHALLLLVIR